MRQWSELALLLRSALDAGLDAVAVLSPSGEPVAIEGAIEAYEVRALAALVSRDGPPDLLRTLFDGELATAVFEQRTVYLGIAGRCVFVMAIAPEERHRSRSAAHSLREQIDGLLRHVKSKQGEGWVPPIAGSSGSGSAPAEAFVWPPDPKRLPN